MDKLDRSGAAAGLGLLNLDRIYNNVCEQIMDPQQCENHLKWPAVATLGAIMAEPSLLAAAAEVAFDGIAPNYACRPEVLAARASPFHGFNCPGRI